MKPTNCPRCGKLFNKILSPVCPQCEKLEEEQFQELRKYIEEYPMATITEVADETGVPTKRILRYIREGRLIVPEGMTGELRCVSCGKPIDEGSFCESCAVKMAKDFAEVYAVNPPPIIAEVENREKAKVRKKGSGFHTRD